MSDKMQLAKEALEFIRDGYDNQDVSHVDFRVRVYQAALDALAALSSEPAPDTRAKASFRFHRYVDGVEMADGVEITRASTVQEAFAKARSLYGRPRGMDLVLENSPPAVAQRARTEITKEMSLAGRKALAVVADRMEEAKLLATSSIDFWQRVGHEPANEIYAAMVAADMVAADQWARTEPQAAAAQLAAPSHPRHRVYFMCQCCEEEDPENAVCCREDIGVMPDGTWLCDNCYADCEKTAYGLAASADDDFEFPRFEDLPRPAPYIDGAALPQSAWRPIETAPKDGSTIIIVKADAEEPDACMAHFRNGNWACMTTEDWDAGSDETRDLAWYLNDATHWMPRPKAPALSRPHQP